MQESKISPSMLNVTFDTDNNAFYENNSAGYTKKPYKKKLLKPHVRKPETFKTFDALMENVNKRVTKGHYRDMITSEKLRAKRRTSKTEKVLVKEFSESSSESEDDEVEQTNFVESIIYQRSQAQINSQYWQINKLFRYLRISNQPGSLLCLCTLRDSKLKDSSCLRAIEDSNGMSLLLNLLSVNDIRCRIASLKILKELAEVNKYSRSITFLGGIKPLIDCLKEDNMDVLRLAADILARLAIFKRARSNIRRYNGLSNLVQLLDVDLDCVQFGKSRGRSNLSENGKVAQSCAEALWVCSKSIRNRHAMRQAGIIPILARLLHSDNANILVPIIGTLQQCASDKHYKISIRTEGMIPLLVEFLESMNPWLKIQCALTIFMCAEDEETRHHVRLLGGLEHFHDLLDFVNDINLSYAVTGAIWKCSLSSENALAFQNMGTTVALVEVMKSTPDAYLKYLRPQISASATLNNLEKTEKILINITGALSELTKIAGGRADVRINNGLETLIKLLHLADKGLIVNVSRTLAQCAHDPSSMEVIAKLDGVRLLVSLLNNSCPLVQASASWALYPVIQLSHNSGELVRSFVGCLEMVVDLLKSCDEEVLTAICGTIAQIALDQENLAVVTDHGIIKFLARLVKTDSNRLRRRVAEAIACCCDWSDNAAKFGSAGVVIPLVNYLRSLDPHVHSATARALYHLSRNPTNSIEMNQAGVARLLFGMIGSSSIELQTAAAGTIGNIRRLAYTKDKMLLSKKSMASASNPANC